MARQDLTNALVGFVFLAILILIAVNNCSVSFKCGEGFVEGMNHVPRTTVGRSILSGGRIISLPATPPPPPPPPPAGPTLANLQAAYDILCGNVQRICDEIKRLQAEYRALLKIGASATDLQMWYREYIGGEIPGSGTAADAARKRMREIQAEIQVLRAERIRLEGAMQNIIDRAAAAGFTITTCPKCK